MSGHYSGVNRLSWKMALAFVFAIAICVWGDYVFFNDAAYLDLMAQARRRSLYRAMPQDAWQVVFVTVTLTAAVIISTKLWMTIKGARAFEIGPEGIRSWPLLRRSQFMEWAAMQSAERIAHNLVIKGVAADGRKSHMWFDMAGHDWKAVMTIIATYRGTLPMRWFWGRTNDRNIKGTMAPVCGGTGRFPSNHSDRRVGDRAFADA